MMRCSALYLLAVSLLLLLAAGVGAQQGISAQQGAPEVASALRVVAADGAPGDLFGCAFTLDGERLAVGSLLDDDQGEDSGSVYVYRRQRDLFVEEAKLVAPGGAAGDETGFSVDLAGDVLVAGAPRSDRGGLSAGAAYVFTRVGGQWDGGVGLAAPVEAHDQLGTAVAVSGDWVAVGAPGDDDGGSAAGAVYVFRRGEAGWQLEAKLLAPSPVAGEGFGFSLSLDGESLAVGAPFRKSGAAVVGAAYVFERGAQGWNGGTRLLPVSAAPGPGQLGYSVSLSGEGVAAGARLDDSAGDNAGAVYVFRRGPAADWPQEARLVAGTVAPGDELGIAVTLEGSALVVGARFDDGEGSDAGAGYVFRRGADGVWREELRLVAAAPEAGEELGFATGLSGTTTALGAYRSDLLGVEAGSVLLFEGESPPELDLSLDCRAPAEVAPGGELVLFLEVSNPSEADAFGATVDDEIPGGLTGARWTCTGRGGASCAVSGQGSLRGESVDLPAGSSLTFRVTSLVSAPAGTTIRNQARVSPPPGSEDVDPGNDAGTCVTQVREVAPPSDLDLAVTVSNGVTSVVPGTAVTYLATVTNAGPSDASEASMSVTIPGLGSLTCSCAAGTSPGPPCSVSGGEAVVEPLALPSAGSLTCTLSGAVDPCALGELVAVASVASGAGAVDRDLSNNQAEDRDPLTPLADLAVSKELLSAGTSAVFALEVVNLGPSCAVGVELADPVPSGAAVESVSFPCSGGFPCSLGSLAPGDPPRSVELSLALPLDCSGEGSLINAATVGSDVADPNLTNNTATATAPLPRVDLAVFKTDGQSQVDPGSALVYTVRVDNLGAVVTEGFVTDDLPPTLLGASWTCLATPGSTCSVQGSGDLADQVVLAPGGEATYSISGTVSPNFLGTLTNTASVHLAGSQEDCQPSNDQSTDVTVVFPPGPAVLKRVLGAFFENELAVFEIVLLNGGTVPLPDGPGDELTDVFPVGLTPVDAVATSGVVLLSGQVLTWNGSIPAGGKVTLTVTVQVGTGLLGEVLCNRAVLETPNGPVLSDDPATPGLADETCLAVATAEAIPALSPAALLLLGLLLVSVALRRLRP